VVNNLRDIESDRLAGKRTLAVQIGSKWTKRQYALLLAMTYAIPVLVWALDWTSGWVLLSWLTLPLAIRLASSVWTAEGAELNTTLARTALLDMLFSMLFAAGIIL
jgi:1,4-dihydroxy-2-naphthoate octaprenyltransferase